MKKFALLYIAVIWSLPLTSIFAQGVDILWQGETYTPPFYEGKSLWTKQSTVTLVAVPYGLGNPASLNYRWSRNGTVLGGVSGVGKSTLTYTDNILSRPQTVKVDIMSGETVRSTASVSIAPVSPSLLVYENNPLYGFMFHKEVGSEYQLESREVTFASFPLFFSGTTRDNQNLNYQWRTNSGSVTTGSLSTYRTPDGAEGSAQIDLQANNTTQITQSASRSFLIEFGSSTDI